MTGRSIVALLRFSHLINRESSVNSFTMAKQLENSCQFQTQRLNIVGYSRHINSQEKKDVLIDQVIEIMSPRVSESLPSGWQEINSAKAAAAWLEQVNKECSFLLVSLKSTNDIIGFIFLYEPEKTQPPFDVRLGYLISEKHWGGGLGSELINGLLSCCRTSGAINIITGGIEAENTGSIKVLEKNGFVLADTNDEGVLFYEYDFHQQ